MIVANNFLSEISELKEVVSHATGVEGYGPTRDSEFGEVAMKDPDFLATGDQVPLCPLVSGSKQTWNIEVGCDGIKPWKVRRYSQ